MQVFNRTSAMIEVRPTVDSIELRGAKLLLLRPHFGFVWLQEGNHWVYVIDTLIKIHIYSSGQDV